jgi:predicted nucleic acid-binding protein
MTYRSEVLPLDAIAGELAGRIDADLKRAGFDIGGPDTMIAAIAIHRGLPLVTGNGWRGHITRRWTTGDGSV